MIFSRYLAFGVADDMYSVCIFAELVSLSGLLTHPVRASFQEKKTYDRTGSCARVMTR